MTIPYNVVPHTGQELEPQVGGKAVSVSVAAPGPLNAEVPAPVWRTIIMRSFAVLMIGCIILMVAFGVRQFNPMMLGMGGMVMLSMLMGGGGMFGGKNPQGELDQKREQYATMLREQRRNAHIVNKHLHNLQTKLYPHPDSLLARCGTATAMWAAVPPRPGGAAITRHDGAIHTSAWGCARIGVGYRRTEPYIQSTANNAPDTYEPWQAAAYMRFIRTQNVITDCPIAVDVFQRAFIVCTGDHDRILAAARAMICSLASNHAPQHLQLGIITEDTDEWDWMKWWPHCTDPTRRDMCGPARLHWFSIADYAADQRHVIGAPPPVTSGDRKTTTGPHRVIFVDIPGHQPEIPAGVSHAGLASHTFVYLRHS